MSHMNSALPRPPVGSRAALRRREAVELLDQTGHAAPELAANLRDIRRLNRFFGGVSTIMRHLPALIAATPAGQPVTVLDLATGSGDIPLAIARWAEEQDRAIEITASDASDEILAIAAGHLGGRSMVTLARYDAREVPLPDASVDIVLCSLALHHFPFDDAVRVLREMDRLARRGFIVNDLARSRLGYAGAWLASHLTTTNRLTRHDAPLSVLRAYTPAELVDLLARAGVRDAVVSRHPWFRMAAVKVMPDGG